MHISVLTIFPELFAPFLGTSLIGRAVADGRLRVDIEDLRRFTNDRHRSVDDEPYGGGGGMVMTAQPWFEAIRQLSEGFEQPPWRVLLSPQGERLDEHRVRQLAGRPGLILMCGRYEGVDQRVIDGVVDQELSIGDFVMSGGELPAMVAIEAVSRQIPGVVGLEDSVEQDSFRNGLLDFPHYTRPREVEGREVPHILLSGDHAKIAAWRRRQSLEATLHKRPDLLEAAVLSSKDQTILAELSDALARKSSSRRAGEPPGLQASS